MASAPLEMRTPGWNEGGRVRKLSMSQMTLIHQGFQEDVEQIARAGVPGIGVHRRKLEEIGIDRGSRLVRDAGLEVSGYMAAGRFVELGREKGVEDTKQCIEIAARLEAGCLFLISGAVGQLTWEEADRRFLDGLSQVIPMAKDYNVRLAFEPVHPIHTHLGHVYRLGDALELAAQVDWLWIVVDLWHLAWDRRFLDDARRGVDRIAIVQISDYDPAAAARRAIDRAPLGQGSLPLRRILRSIDDAGFNGYYDVEVITSLTDEQKRGIVADSKAAFGKIWE